MIAEHAATSIIEWGVAGSALEQESGDLHVVLPFPDGVLVTLMDGLGHGPEAAFAACAAVPVLEAHAAEPVLAVVQRCHEALRKTRGVVMSVASFSRSDAAMSWIGVGNVEGTLLRSRTTGNLADEALVTRGGVVGYNLPPLRAKTVPVFHGDLLILATDGVRSGFGSHVMQHADPGEIARTILATHGKASDDAHVLVARYLG